LSKQAVELTVGSEFAGYRIEEIAARGGMGVVYRAIQEQLGRTVALKLVTPALARDASFRDRFRREWMIAASIEHPNVIPVYEAGEDDGALFLAMRWVEGTNLRDLIDGNKLEPARAVRLVSQVAAALDAAHERGLIHRDVKPANILIADEDHVYLTDFGLTKHASSISGLTRTGSWVGTVDYTAPEQIEGTTVSPRTDVYSLGAVFFETLTGRPPHRRDNDLATLWAHMYTAAPSVTDVAPDAPAQFDPVLQKAMAKDPEDRYATAGEFGRAARAALGEEIAPPPARVPVTATGDRPPPPGSRAGEPADAARPWHGRGREILVGAAALGVVAVIAGILALGGGSDEPSTDTGAAPSSAASVGSRQVGIASNWRRKAPLPTARQNMDGTVLDGTIWVVGGLTPGGSNASRRVEGYDPVINGWKAGPDLPVKLHHEMAVNYKDELVVIGGWIPQGSDPSALVSDRVFALRNGQWEALPPLKRPRAAGAAAVVGDKIVVFGGQNEGRLLKTTEVFDGKQWKEVADIPTPREHLAAAADRNYAYAVGGRDLGPDKNYAALERYDPESDTWQRLPDMPTARGGLGAAITGGHLIAVGGESPTRALGAVQSFNIATQDWSDAPSMRTPRHGLDVEAIGDALYALGGATRPGHASAVDDAEVTRLTR
jgi:non-specific serine/threonine protein kinase